MAGSYQFYHYVPSVNAAIAFAALFFATSLVHAVQLVLKGGWRYFTVFLIGCLLEGIGYVARAISARQEPDYTLGPFVIQSIMILIAPTLYAASIYMLLGRLIVLVGADRPSATGKRYAVIPPRWLTKVFVAGDVVSFLAQSAGGGMIASAKDPSNAQTAQNIILAGLALQIVFFGLFMVAILVFDVRIRKRPTEAGAELAARGVRWQWALWTLYAASALIMVRSVFRVVMYGQGQTGQLESAEGYSYGLDAVPMLLVPVLFNVLHPTRVLGRRAATKMYQHPEGQEMEGYSGKA